MEVKNGMADKREYLREWKRKNPDKVKQYLYNSLRREVIADIEAGRLDHPFMNAGRSISGEMATRAPDHKQPCS